MALANNSGLTVDFMKGNGKMISKMGEADTYTPMEIFMMDIGKMENHMGKAST